MVKKSRKEELFISISDPKEKRKSMLLALKESLLLQNDLERIKLIRAQKYGIIKEIKKKIKELENSYRNLKNLLPSTKSVMSYIEKELKLIDREIGTLRKDEEYDKKQEEKLELMKRKITNNPTYTHTEQKSTNKEISRLDRIKNNLKVIEEKLNKLQ